MQICMDRLIGSIPIMNPKQKKLARTYIHESCFAQFLCCVIATVFFYTTKVIRSTVDTWGGELLEGYGGLDQDFQEAIVVRAGNLSASLETCLSGMAPMRLRAA